MSAVTCCVLGCRSEYFPGTCIKFYRFPKDADMRQRWMSAVPYKYNSINEHAVVCSLHFPEETELDSPNHTNQQTSAANNKRDNSDLNNPNEHMNKKSKNNPSNQTTKEQQNNSNNKTPHKNGVNNEQNEQTTGPPKKHFYEMILEFKRRKQEKKNLRLQSLQNQNQAFNPENVKIKEEKEETIEQTNIRTYIQQTNDISESTNITDRSQIKQEINENCDYVLNVDDNTRNHSNSENQINIAINTDNSQDNRQRAQNNSEYRDTDDEDDWMNAQHKNHEKIDKSAKNNPVKEPIKNATVIDKHKAEIIRLAAKIDAAIFLNRQDQMKEAMLELAKYTSNSAPNLVHQTINTETNLNDTTYLHPVPLANLQMPNTVINIPNNAKATNQVATSEENPKTLYVRPTKSHKPLKTTALDRLIQQCKKNKINKNQLSEIKAKKKRFNECAKVDYDALNKLDPHNAVNTMKGLKVAIVSSRPTYKLNVFELNTIKTNLEIRLFELCRSNAYVPKFKGEATVVDGALSLWCVDRACLYWLEIYVLEQRLLNINIAVKKQWEIFRDIRVALMLPISERNQNIKDIVKRENRWVDVDKWYFCVAKNQGDKFLQPIRLPPTDLRKVINRDRLISYKSVLYQIQFFGKMGKITDVPPNLNKGNSF